MSPACGPCVGVSGAVAQIGDAKQARVWWREIKQAMGEAKSGPVETGLTELAATGLAQHV